MPLKTTNHDDLVAHLRALGLQPGMDVLVQTRLTTFGVIEGGVETVYAALRAVIGDQATIVVPTYRLQAKPDEIYDRATSPSIQVGVFSEYVRSLPGAVRSRCPMHGHTAIGPKAGLLEAVSGDVSFGPGSDFDVLHRAGFSIAMLGCNFLVCTFVIHVQAMHGAVPYRHFLDLTRRRRNDDGSVSDARIRYYARNSTDVIDQLPLVADILRHRGLLREAKAAYGMSTFATMADIQAVELEMLAADPMALVPSLGAGA